MQMLAGIERPTTIYRPVIVQVEKQPERGQSELSAEKLVLKTVKLALLLRNRQELTTFQNLGQKKDNAALPTALFMLIRANKLNVSGMIVEEALGVLRAIIVLGIGGLGKLVSGEWELGAVLRELGRARILQCLTEWRMARSGRHVLKKPLEAYLSLLIKRSKKSTSSLVVDKEKELILEERFSQFFQQKRESNEKKFAVDAWRMQLWIRKFQKKQTVKRFIEKVNQKGNMIKKRMRTAGVLHKMNSGKRLLQEWLQHTRTALYLEKRTVLMRRLSTLRSNFEKWRSRSGKKFILKKHMGMWRGRLAESRNGQLMSQELMRTRLREAAFQIWRQKHHRAQALEERAQVYRRIQEDHQRRRIVVGMQKLCQVRHLLEKRVENWVAAHRKQKYFSLFQKDYYAMKKARWHYEQGLRYGGLLAWSGALKSKRMNAALRVQYVREWRKQANSKIAVQRFFKGKLLTQVAWYHPSSAMWEHLNTAECSSYENTSRLLTVAKCFLHWRHRTRKQRRLRSLQEEFMRKVFGKKFSNWRGEALVRSSKRREPQVLRAFFFNRWRQQSTQAKEAEEAKEIRLADYQVGREYIRTYTAFKRWEQLFQVHKIEEHLCSQNLRVHFLRRKAEILRQMRLQAMASLISKFNKRKRMMGRLFEKWHQRGQLVVQSRRRRVQRRFVERWREMLEVAQARKVSAVFQKRIQAAVLAKWNKVLGLRRAETQWALDVHRGHVLRSQFVSWRKGKVPVMTDKVISTKPLVQIPVMDLPVTPVRHNHQFGIKKGEEEEEEKERVLKWFQTATTTAAVTDGEDIFMTPIAKSN